MSLKYPFHGKQLIEAIQELDAIGLHETFDNLHYFQAELPGAKHPMIGMIMGNGGVTYGMNLFCGPDALATYRTTCESPTKSRRAMRKANLLGYEMLPARKLTIESRKWIKKTKYRTRSDERYPDFLILEPGRRARTPNDRDVRLLLYVVRGLIQCVDDGEFAPSHIYVDAPPFTMTISGKVDRPTVSIRRATRTGKTKPAAAQAKPPASSVSPFELSGLPRHPATWLVGTLLAPSRDDEDDPDSGLLPVILILIDIAEGPVGIVPIARSDAESIWLTLVDIFKGRLEGAKQLNADLPEPGLPETLLFDDKDLCAIASGVLEPLDVTCRTEEEGSRLLTLLAKMEDSMFSITNDNREMVMAQWSDTEPDSSDTHGWKAVDDMIRQWMYKMFDTDDRFFGVRALKRYFGGEEDIRHLFAEYEQFLIADAYCEWFAMHYRPTCKSRTVAEQWQENEDLPKPVLTLLAARTRSVPSVYRLGDIDDDAGTIVFEDVLDGGHITVTDFALASMADPGWLIPATVFPAGDFHFFATAGPAVKGMRTIGAMKFIASCRAELSLDDRRDRPHLMGRLWNSYASRSTNTEPPTRQNSDGHEMLFHTASYKLDDPADVRQALLDRPLVEWNENEDCFVWFRETVAPGMLGEGTLLGRLLLADRELLVETNSKQRHAACRKWLETMPGVTFLNVQAKRPTTATSSPDGPTSRTNL